MQHRIDLYAPIHKAYRAFLCETLLAVGRVDVDDAVEFNMCLGRVNALLASLRHHAHHEDAFLHPLLTSRGIRPGSIADHLHQEHEITDLEVLVAQARSALPAQRDALVLRLYRRLGAFVADNFGHMLCEEIDNNATLWAHYSDVQLVTAHNALLASIDPHVFMEIMAWMLPSLTPKELVQVLDGTRAHAPAFVFDALMTTALRTLPEKRFDALRARFGWIPPLDEAELGLAA
jgi:hypothetical protein